MHDTVVKVEKIAPSWASCVNVLPHYTDTVRVLRVDTVVVHDTIRVEF